MADEKLTADEIGLLRVGYYGHDDMNAALAEVERLRADLAAMTERVEQLRKEMLLAHPHPDPQKNHDSCLVCSKTWRYGDPEAHAADCPARPLPARDGTEGK